MPDPCYQAKDHAAADLCAQWRAAIAAEKSADVGYWGNWIGAVGGLLSFVSVVLVVFALRQTEKSLCIAQRDRATATRRAVASSEETASAIAIAKHGNVLAQEQMQRHLRAYITVDVPYISAHPDIGTILEYNIVATNDGATPAKNVRWRSKLTVAFDEELEAELVLPDVDVVGSSAVVGATKPIRMVGRLPEAITQNYKSRLDDGTAWIYAIGEIQYVDVFGSEWVTRYRAHYDYLRGFVWDIGENDAT